MCSLQDLLSCANLCTKNEMQRGQGGCCSFEWSKSEKRCKLHHDCLTSKPQNKDFFTCRKEGDWPCVFFLKKISYSNQLGSWGGGTLQSWFVSWFHKAMIVWTDSSCTMATSRERGLSREWTKWKIKQSKQIFCLFMLWMAHTSQNMKDYFDNSVFLFRCWKECASSSDCCSYEYSPSVKMCNLNKKCEPEEKKVGDFLFCKKLKKPWVVNKIHVQFTAE